ncbi:helix loop helix DNA-binding domain protein [Medicago truncatula]|uniref:Helix loop helix DNA-binding domain protein n=1 Tax=Medicago truncatula TaxID=3880 RepID=A0A072VBH5_MEDTR|nr:helix loop helix DNA-binding domain protein [Medicago truncatula]
MDHDQQECQPSSTKVERKVVEKNRRNQMKILYSKLNSLLPSYNSKVLHFRFPSKLFPHQTNKPIFHANLNYHPNRFMEVRS